MKVLYFSDNISGHNQRFLEKLASAAIEVWFLDPTSDHPPNNWLPPGVRWVLCERLIPKSSDPLLFVRFLPELRRILKEIKPDLVHAGPIHTCGYLTALSHFHPWLLTSWGSDLLFDAERSQEVALATRTALSSADGFFCDCNTVRSRAKQYADIPDTRIVQFPWGLRKGSFEPSGPLPLHENYVHEPGTHVFISTRSWEPLYGIDTMLRAFLQAYSRNDSLRLLLLGNESGSPGVLNFIASHGLTRVIRTPGSFKKEEMPRWFRAAETYVSCALSDGTSISLLEAMATGLPVIVTDIPSNREWVSDGQNGWLAAAGSSAEFAECFLRAGRLSDKERLKIAARNQQLISERADWDRNFPMLLEMYERLTGCPLLSGGAN